MFKTIGKYEILRKIGSGGMAEVYEARDMTLMRRVAIKVLFPHYAQDETFIHRFKTEARAAASLEHPNIITIYEIGESNDIHYIAMEYIDGADLGTLINNRGRCSLDETVVILSQVASALDFAHQKGVIHRDIKPRNILIGKDGGVKVVDFGIAKIVAGTQYTRTGMLIGTVEYMAPEIWEGKSATNLSDQYALGIVAYEMLTGEVPFTAETPIAVGHQHTTQAPDLSVISEPDVVKRAFRKVLDKKPYNRFNSCEEFLKALSGQIPVITPSCELPKTKIIKSEKVVKREFSPPGYIIWLLVALVFVLGGSLLYYAIYEPSKKPILHRKTEIEHRAAPEEKPYEPSKKPILPSSQETERMEQEAVELEREAEMIQTEQDREGVCPDASSRYLTEADLDGMTAWELTLCRNEIYARHGRPFRRTDLQNYFNQQPWYRINPNYSDSLLNSYERRNAVFIREYQIRHGRMH